MSTPVTEYFYPATVSEALDALCADGSRIIAGGTDLVIELKEGGCSSSRLVDITRIPDLTHIRTDGNFLEIGAASSFADISRHPVIRAEFSALAEAASLVGSPQIRNRGTIGGNLSTCSSAGDTLCPLTAFGAIICIADKDGEHAIAMDDFWKKDARARLSTEAILTKVILQRSLSPWMSSFIKLGRRESLAISRISLTVALRTGNDGIIHEARLSVGSAGRYAYRVPEAEQLCCGSTVDAVPPALIKKALSDAVHVSLGTRPTVEYKAQAVQGLFEQAIKRLRSSF